MTDDSKRGEDQASGGEPGAPHLYWAGTLSYTKPALAIIFFWLIWGDFCYTLMESVTGPIMQLKFQKLNASNMEIGMILGTIPSLVYSFLNPIISFKSDRFRSRWGRRIPFIAGSLPFLVIFLVFLAFGDQAGKGLFDHIAWLHQHLPWLHPVRWAHDFAVAVTPCLIALHLSWVHLPFLHAHPDGTLLSANQTIILTLGGLLVTFTFFNTFVTSTFWYLFNDVVPELFLARFMSWFRFFGVATGSLYSFFIFPYSATHSKEIFLGAALLYLVGFGLMCYNVREGKYPPPPPYTGGQTGPIAAIKTYGKETHAFPHYWYLWVCTFIGSIGGGAGTFNLFFQLSIGLNLFQIGQVNGTVSAVVAVLTIGAGWLADRFHPIRVVLVGTMIGLFIVTPSNLIWLFWHPIAHAEPVASSLQYLTSSLSWYPILPAPALLPCGMLTGAIFGAAPPVAPEFLQMSSWVQAPAIAFWVYMAINVGLSAPAQALGGMWDPPMLMRLFPRSHYGQFCSTNAVWRAIGGIFGGTVAGAFLDFVTSMVGKEHAYFYLPFWSFAFGLPSFLLLLGLYRSWKKHGGDDAYVAPVLESSLNTVPTAVAPALTAEE